MSIKYRYALDEDQQVVDVEDLTEADRKDYECIACGHVLCPVMGKIRRKHFRHQADVECSGETYLHWLGKLVFRQVYRQCLDTGTAFEIRLARRRICTNCENGPCEIESRLVTYDLTDVERRKLPLYED